MEQKRMAIFDTIRNRILIVNLENPSLEEVQEIGSLTPDELVWTKFDDTIPILTLDENTGDVPDRTSGPNEIDTWDTRIVSYNECAGL